MYVMASSVEDAKQTTKTSNQRMVIQKGISDMSAAIAERNFRLLQNFNGIFSFIREKDPFLATHVTKDSLS